MLASPVTAFVLALGLGTAPMPVPVPSQPAVPEVSPEPVGEGTAQEPSSEEPTSEEPPSEEPPSEEPPSEEPPPVDEPATDEPADDAGDDPFGDDADPEDEPWPDDVAQADHDAGPLPDYDPLRDSPQALRARHWVRTGIGTTATGGALLIGAIIMGASDPCARGSGNNCQEGARNRAALIMGIPAAILIGGGATMLGIGLERQRNLAVDLQASRQGFGVGVRGRF